MKPYILRHSKNSLVSIIFFFVSCILLLVTFSRLSFAQNCGESGLHQGLISALSVTGGTIGNIDQKCVLDAQAAYRAFNVPSYEDLENQFYTLSRSSAKKAIDVLPNNTGWAFSSAQGDGIYLQTETVNISAVNGSGGVQIIFIRGDLNLTGNILYADSDSSSGLVFIVSGDINIYSNVTQVNAVLISSGKICSAYGAIAESCLSGSTTTPPLTVNGSLISLNKTPLSGGENALLMKRSLAVNNQPAELINKQPKYLYILRNGLLTKDLILVQEDKNYIIPSQAPTPVPTTTPAPTSTPAPGPCPNDNPLSISDIQSMDASCVISI